MNRDARPAVSPTILHREAAVGRSSHPEGIEDTIEVFWALECGITDQ